MNQEIKIDENTDVLVASIKTATSLDFVIQQLMKPATFRRRDNVKKFIEKCEKNF